MEKFQPDFGKAHKIYQYSKRNVPKDFRESYQLEKISILRIVNTSSVHSQMAILQHCAFSDCYTIAACILRLSHCSIVHFRIVTRQQCTLSELLHYRIVHSQIVTLQHCAFSYYQIRIYLTREIQNSQSPLSITKNRSKWSLVQCQLQKQHTAANQPEQRYSSYEVKFKEQEGHLNNIKLH